MRLASALLLIGILCPAVLAAQSACTDISSVDFHNRVLVARRATHPVFYGIFNGPAPGGPIRLSDGRFYDWDAAPGISDRNAAPDWLTEIDRDLVVQPPQSAGVRVLSLVRTHLTGTGSFTYIFGFACQDGHVSKIFEASGQGLKLGKITDSAMVMDVAVWAERDAHASPSRVVSLHYVWSPRLRRYARSSSNAACPWMP
jgi:hypothetical protein